MWWFNRRQQTDEDSDLWLEFPKPAPAFVTLARLPRLVPYAGGVGFSWIRSFRGLLKIAAFPHLWWAAAIEAAFGATCIQLAELGAFSAVHYHERSGNKGMATWARLGAGVVMLASIALSLHAGLDSADYAALQTMLTAGWRTLGLEIAFGVMVSVVGSTAIDVMCFFLGDLLAEDMVSFVTEWAAWFAEKTGFENQQRDELFADKKAQREDERRRRRERREQQTQTTSAVASVPTPQLSPRATKDERKAAVAALLAAQPSLTHAALAAQVGVHERTIDSYVAELRRNNGHGGEHGTD